jgi:hypothetical protein
VNLCQILDTSDAVAFGATEVLSSLVRVLVCRLVEWVNQQFRYSFRFAAELVSFGRPSVEVDLQFNGVGFSLSPFGRT